MRCLDTVAAVHARARDGGVLDMVVLALTRVVGVIVRCWVCASTRSRVDIAVDMTGMGVAEAFLSRG